MKPLSLRQPPAGAQFTGLKTPKETVQMIGKPKVKVPESISVDLGVVDIYVTNYGKNIQFGGGGLETDVGKRLTSPTKGMSIPTRGVPLGVRGLPFGTTLGQLLLGDWGTDAQRDLGERTLAQRFSRMAPEEIAQGIKDVGLIEPKYERHNKQSIDVNAVRIEEILSHVPDRVRVEVKELLKREYILLSGVGYAELVPSWRRQRALGVEALSGREVRARKKKARSKLKVGNQKVGNQKVRPETQVIRIL